MFDKRIWLALACAGTLTVGGAAVASDQSSGMQQQGHKAHKHHHKNAHDMLGEKLHQNGKHAVDKISAGDVVAEVSNGKVVNMTAGNLPAHKVKSKHKMAALSPIRYAALGEIRLAQDDTYYYGYCFDDGVDENCYWYPADDVTTTDTWDDYTED